MRKYFSAIRRLEKPLNTYAAIPNNPPDVDKYLKAAQLGQNANRNSPAHFDTSI
jgi:hypothetical protein